MTKALAKSCSSLVAETLAGSWRRNPPPLDISAQELAQVAPLLLGSGAASLGWWRVHQSARHKNSTTARELQQAYRLLALQDTIHEQEIKKVFTLLRAAGVEPLLVKGWAIARLYPESVLRPFGDVDIGVLPEQHRMAEEVLKSEEAKGLWADLHKGFDELEDRTVEELYERSHLVKLGEVDVRVLGAEDHLALLAVHLLKHGAWRPLWLCDIGVMLESLPAGFDWELCLGQDKRRANWINCTIGLAHQLLKARIDDLPLAPEARTLPRWLVPCVLKQWEQPFARNQSPMSYRAPMASYLRHPGGLLRDMRTRWPNPIVATISLRGPLNGLPRLPFQLGNCAARAAQFLTNLPGLWREHV